VKRTPLHDRHVALGARLVEFAGWEMPVQYPAGIVAEHLRTRKAAGLFDVCHMGRFSVRGHGALGFLQAALTNDAAALAPGRAQYTMIPTPTGGALDDAYLYRLEAQEYLLVVNAANREQDWRLLRSRAGRTEDLKLDDLTDELAMLSLQGPESQRILHALVGLSRPGQTGPSGHELPAPGRNSLRPALLEGAPVTIARTGYTGEPLGFELIFPASEAGRIWDRLLELGAAAIGLGARDTLRLEAALPLYGHELGTDPQGREIPILSSPAGRFAVSLGRRKGEFPGRKALERQLAASRVAARRASASADLRAEMPRRVRPLCLLDKGIARAGAEVFAQASSAPGQRGEEEPLGWITSGTMAPYWLFEGDGPGAAPGEGHDKRAIALALLDVSVQDGTVVEIDIRGRRSRALVVPRLLRADSPPYARPVLWEASEAPDRS